MNRVLPARFVLALIAVGVLMIALADIARASVVIYDPFDAGDGSVLALPDLAPGGPAANTHRAVLYNHGGMGDQIGGDLSQNVEMLADEGFIAYAKKRSGTSISETLEEVKEGLADLMNLSPALLDGRAIISGPGDPGVSLIGYSRGALMSLGVAGLREDGEGALRRGDKVILMAMAPGAGDGWTEGGAMSPDEMTTADQYLNASNLALIDEASTEFFMMVAANDMPTNNPNNNLVDLMTTAHDLMVNRSGSPVTSTLKVYDDWMPPVTGHNLFHKVASGGQDLVNGQGYYWHDVIHFLNNQTIDTEYTALISPSLPPVITLVGPAELALEALPGTSYADAGATAWDEEDGDISGDVEISGAMVNRAQPGEYAVHFDVSDSGGMPADRVTRTVRVQDTLPPVITLSLGGEVIHVGDNTATGLGGEANTNEAQPQVTGSVSVGNAYKLVSPIYRVHDLTQPDGTPVKSRQDWSATAPAGSSVEQMPIATVWDHQDQSVALETTILLVDLDGVAQNEEVEQIDFTKRSTYLFLYDAQDSSGNHAEQVVLALILNDHTAPVISVAGVAAETLEAGSDWTLGESTASDNLDGDLTGSILYTVSNVTDGSVLGTGLTYAQAAGLVDLSVIADYVISMTVSDDAGIYGHNNRDNSVTAVKAVAVRDTLAPVITEEPQGQTVGQGVSLVFSVAATSSEPLSYQWKKDGADLMGATDPSLTLAATDRGVGGVYSVLVSNSVSGVQSAGATLRVLVSQRIESLENLGGGGFRLRFGDHDGHALQEADKHNFTIQWSRNLSEWMVLTGVSRNVVNGRVVIDDPGAVERGNRFYRVTAH